MNQRRQLWLAIVLMLAFAATRWPGLMPENFSAAYALAFCAGAFFPRKLAWWLPLATLAASDLAINLHYLLARGVNAFQPFQLVNYVAFTLIIWLGRRAGPQASFLRLLAGGILGAVLFYLLTNTAAWLFNPFNNPEYTMTLAGWLIALTKGTAGHPPTWEFFRNTLMSGGLFTALFAGAMKWSERAESAAEKDADQKAPEETEAPTAEPEESKA